MALHSRRWNSSQTFRRFIISELILNPTDQRTKFVKEEEEEICY
jgi:hypothetical protein